MRENRKITFGAVDLNNVLVDRIVKIRLFPGDANLMGGNLL